MKRVVVILLAAFFLIFMNMKSGSADTTLEKINRTGTLTIGGKRIAAQQGSTNARIIRERVPSAKLLEFPDQPAAFQALAQGQVQAYTNDGIQLAGLKAKAPKPDDWAIVGDFFSHEPYGM